MDQELKSRILAQLQVHEATLAILLSPLLQACSPKQREELERRLSEPPSLGEVPPELQNLGIDASDKLAGFAIDYKAAMRRLFEEAAKKAGSR